MALAEYFQNKLVDSIHFMDILNLKDSVEKDTFFCKLPNVAEPLPREIVPKDDGSPVSIFALSGNNAQDGHLAAGRNGVKRLRTVLDAPALQDDDSVCSVGWAFRGTHLAVGTSTGKVQIGLSAPNVTAPSGLLMELNPGIINYVRSKKQVCSVIEAM